MSSRKSSSTGEGLPPGKYGERTPLRSLGNEMLHVSVHSSRLKSSNDAVKMTKGDAPVCDPDHTRMIQTSVPMNDKTSAEDTCGLGDITFKSFVCPGGEVELSASAVCAEESIVLPDDQATYNPETEDTVISDSMIVQSCGDHVEHPYYSPEMMNASSVYPDTSCQCEISSTTLASMSMDDKSATENSGGFESDCCGEQDVTWKSLVCDGGEVEVADVARQHNETIPLPRPQLGETSGDNSVNTADLSVCGQMCEAEHADHPYCSSANSALVNATLSEIPDGFEKPANGLSDVTFKSFICTGGEIEISDGAELENDTTGIPLPADYTTMSSLPHSYSINQSISPENDDPQNGNDHLDHPYCNSENYSSIPSADLPAAEEPLPCSTDAMDEVKQMSLVVADSQTCTQEAVAFGSLIGARGGAVESNGTHLSEKTFPLLDDQAMICQCDDKDVPAPASQDEIRDDHKCPNCHVESGQAQETLKHSMVPEDSTLPSVLHKSESSDLSKPVASAETQTHVEVQQQQHLEPVSEMHLNSGLPESTETKDSALGSTGNEPVLSNSGDSPRVEQLPDVLKVLSQCPSVASMLQCRLFSPVVRRASLAVSKPRTDPAFEHFLADDSAREGEKSFVAPVAPDSVGLWAEQLESPMPRPLFNSTLLGYRPQSGPVSEPDDAVNLKPCTDPQSEVEKPELGFPLIQDGPLQQQLRQMAEFLILASGKMGPVAVGAPAPAPAPAAVVVPSPAETHSVCVGTSAVTLVDRSLNTSGQFERKRDFSVADSCTLTEPLLWNVPPGSLEGLPRQELEQRLQSSMIMVEALVQQLAAARAQRSPPAGPTPSELREKLVQTEHTELSQTTMHRNLYMEALRRISELELDRNSLQNLIQSMQDMRVTTTSLSRDTDAALSSMKEMEDIVREDHQSLVSHYGQMKSLFERTKETQTRMMQKVKDALHQKEDMRTQMEEAVAAKEAAFSTMEQLRKHCASEISALEMSVGSQQELLAALNQAYPEQVTLNQAYTETLDSASELLSQTMGEQSSLMRDLCTVRGLLQKTTPMLLKLNEKAAAALRDRDEHISAKNQAVAEREQIEEELNGANVNLQTAREQIGDLNLQVTILNSEMGVLRQKLTEREDERGQLERKVTELSATVSSTLASYTFLEQALASETTKLQQSWRDIQQATDRANELETLLGQSEQRVCQLSQALSENGEQLSQFQTLSQTQEIQIQKLQDVCTQLGGVHEENEFLQMENALAREQISESERLLRTNLQGLRERNIQCEDLKGELGQLQLEKESLQEQLENTKSRASTTQLELKEKLAQAVTDITLLHHTLRGLTNELHAALNDQKADKDLDSQSAHNMERRHPSSSFVDSIMVALTAEKDGYIKPETPPGSDTPEPQRDTLFSETSAFTRITAFTPKKGLNSLEAEMEEDDGSNVTELLLDLGSTVTELASTLKLVQERKDAQLDELHNTIYGLQEEQQAGKSKHEAEVFELKHQLNRLSSLAERGSQALEQKAQDDKTVANLSAEIQDAQEFLIKAKAESNELRKEVVELRRSLQQSKIEGCCLREELKKAGGPSANPVHFMEEKIQLLKEVERLKLSLQEVEQARAKLLERAKRHQMIHQSNQLKSENELQMLNNMINKVRETLLSLPEVVKKCEQLQLLVEYIG